MTTENIPYTFTRPEKPLPKGINIDGITIPEMTACPQCYKMQFRERGVQVCSNCGMMFDGTRNDQTTDKTNKQ